MARSKGGTSLASSTSRKAGAPARNPLPKHAPARWRDPSEPEVWPSRLKFVTPWAKPSRLELEQAKTSYYEGDPLADAVIEWMHRAGMGPSWAMFETALKEGIDKVASPPPELVAFFAVVDRRPAWVDEETLKRACRMALRNSGVGAIVGYCALLGGYAVAGLTKPLVITRSLDKIATQRLIETSQFVYDVYMSEGMGRFSDGFISTLRVRMLHAMVRYKLSHSDWDMERWGLPINQVDLGATLLAFTVINLMGQRMLGMVIPPSEGRDFMHLWRYVGFLQGVADKYNPATEWEALRLVPVLLGTQEGPDADGRALAKSLLNTRYDWWPKNLSGQAAARVELELASVFTRLLAGEDTGDQLGLPKNALAYGVVALLPPVNLLREAWRLAIPGATARAEASGKANFRREMDRLLGGKRTQFAHHRS